MPVWVMDNFLRDYLYVEENMALMSYILRKEASLLNR